MVAPFTSYSKVYNTGKVIFKASGSRQKPPYVNTAYLARRHESFTGFMSPDGTNVHMENTVATAKTIATNQAKARLVGQLGQTSQIGSTLTSERKATFSTLTSFVTTAFLSARAVKKGNLLQAARILGVAPPTVQKVSVRRKAGRGPLRKSRKRYMYSKTVLVLPSGRRVAHSLSNWWLWWSYAISPLMGDMYNAVDVLQREQPWKRIRASGKGTGFYQKVYSAASIHTFVADCKVSISVNVRLDNPNLFLANQLGLTNPVQWINEGIPFSFVIDWFSNLSQVIGQMTDFLGLETSDPMTASKSVLKTRMPTIYGYEIAEKRVFQRELVIPQAKLRFAYERFQWQRGANAIALLVGFLKKP